MTLDLDDLIGGWECPPGELRARLLTGRDGQELVQLRVDLGVMQMFTEGRPDGERCHGLPSARDYVEHELRLSSGHLQPQHWQELERELVQTNYRRMAVAAVADDALRNNDADRARRCIQYALRDIDECLATLQLLDDHGGTKDGFATLAPSLVFDRGRLGVQGHIMEGRIELAIELADAATAELNKLLVELGYDEQQRGDDAGLRYLQQVGQQLRQEYGIAQTLREQLAQAIEDEDFGRAAALRDELTQREAQDRRPGSAC